LILIHELAHAAVAHILGLRVFGIAIGVGRTVWSGKSLGMTWAINLVPAAGVTAVGTRPMPNIRLRLFLIYVVGPLSHVALAYVFYLLAESLPVFAWGRNVLNLLVIVNIILAVSNLYPRKTSQVLGVQGTDGWHLLHVFSLDESEMTKRYVAYYVGEAMQEYAENDFVLAKQWLDKALALDETSSMARNMLGLIQMAAGEHQVSRQTFCQLLETEDARDAGLRNLLLNNIAYLDVLIEDSSLLAEADQYSAEALQHLPWVPAVIGTRGTVLVEVGQLTEGITLLQKSMSLHPDKHGKALNACHLAIGELRRGNIGAAQKYLAAAKTLDPKCMLVPRVETELETFVPGTSDAADDILPAAPQSA
jgi:Tfp pilus assembly protein PilF